METSKGKLFLNTLGWGLALWLFGYLLGFLFFMFVPKEAIGWYVMPFGVAAALWVLFTKIRRPEFSCYVGLGFVWTVLAVALDYVFLVQLLKAADYYKPDVYLYYALTFLMPVFVGWYKFRSSESR